MSRDGFKQILKFMGLEIQNGFIIFVYGFYRKGEQPLFYYMKIATLNIKIV